MLSLNQTLITWGCVHKSDRTQRGHLIHLIAKWYVFQLKRHSENSTQARAHIPRLRKNMYSGVSFERIGRLVSVRGSQVSCPYCPYSSYYLTSPNQVFKPTAMSAYKLYVIPNDNSNTRYSALQIVKRDQESKWVICYALHTYR